MRYIMKWVKLLIVLAILSIGFGFRNNPAYRESNYKHASPSAVSFSDLKTSMRKLWEDHITWTRNVILCIMDGLPGTDQAVTRLLSNQDDIGNAIKPFYGDAAGAQLTNLLRVHITTAADLLKAAKSGNDAAFQE